ncbi:hypothetical protein Lalb_Chr23g0272421 [Lupinus albus]|uniref:Sugar phosphate transporter domain-containing protein n=1 Tax=Lupinus albus TaxID=3870 RepID=A0A6A4NBW4_LUPAL|nr:hypothetical protein Lalb_Chr23g0272421 [Lupinus albus]
MIIYAVEGPIISCSSTHTLCTNIVCILSENDTGTFLKKRRAFQKWIHFVLFIILSCSIAVGTNLSQFICIGRFTAVTFQVLGHMKTILVLILGFIFFGKEGLNLQVVLGMLIAIMGMVWYGNASSKPGGKERRSFSIPTTKTPDYSAVPVSTEPDEKV